MQSMVVSCKRSSPDILEAIFSLSFFFLRPPGPNFDLFFISDWASEIALAVAAAVLTGLLPVSAAFAVSGVGVGADEVDDEAVAVLGGGAAGGGVDEFESVTGNSVVIGTSFG